LTGRGIEGFDISNIISKEGRKGSASKMEERKCKKENCHWPKLREKKEKKAIRYC